MKYRAVTRAQLVAILDTQCSPMPSNRVPRDGTPEGYVIGPDVNGRLCHIASCFTLTDAQERAEEANARTDAADMTNPRYIAYAKAHGHTPEGMLAHDTEAHPGGKMGGFMVWMSERWAAWRKARGRKRDDILSDADHADFDAFIGGGS